VAEGAGLFPEQVEPLLTDPRAAVWLVASAELIRHVRATRERGFADLTSDPARAFENLVARDVAIAEYVRRGAALRGFKVIEVDLPTIGDVPGMVERHFAPLLKSRAA
jgi:hypothetical protein